MLFQFVLGHFRSKNLNRCRTTNIGDNLVIISTEMVPETAVTYFLRCTIPGNNRGIKDIMFHVGGNDASSLDIIGDTYDDSLIAIEPHAYFFFHWFSFSDHTV